MCGLVDTGPKSKLETPFFIMAILEFPRFGNKFVHIPGLFLSVPDGAFLTICLLYTSPSPRD